MLVFQERSSNMDCLYDDDIHFDTDERRLRERPTLNMVVRKIREQVILHIIVIFSVCVCVTSCSIWLLKHVTSFNCFIWFRSLKNFWPLICYGGEVLLELWSLKDTSGREMIRYLIPAGNMPSQYIHISYYIKGRKGFLNKRNRKFAISALSSDLRRI